MSASVSSLPLAGEDYLNRITIEPGKRSGQPCIRGLRITVWDVLKWLSSGVGEKQILDEYPELEPEDFLAVFAYAARLRPVTS